MTYNELQDRLHKLIFKAAWDGKNFTEAEKQEALQLQEEQKDYPEWIEEQAYTEWYKRNMR